MIVKILSKTASFNAVQYNTNKIQEGKGELMHHTNFPFIDEIPRPGDIKNYLQSISKTNSRVKNPQFHATISVKEDEFSKNQLTDIGKEYMKLMGYEKQPYIIVFHGDTDNNHIHIVSTRVTIDGKKINHNYENIRSQKALKTILKEKFGIDEEKNLANLLKYKVSSDVQMKNLLELNGFTLVTNEKGNKVYHRGVFVQDIQINKSKINVDRTNDLKQIFNQYSVAYATQIKKTQNNWSCEMLEKLKTDHNIDILFHQSEKTNIPFGYTIIDNENRNVLKGSQVFNMNGFVSGLSEDRDNNYEFRHHDTETLKEKSEDNTKENDHLHSPSIIGSFISTALSGGSSGDKENEQAERSKKRKRKR